MLIDSPIGTAEERASGVIWPGHWHEVNSYLAYYEIQPGIWNYHTGADLVMHWPDFNSIVDQPLYAIADGKVIFSGFGSGTWGWLVVIEHTDAHGNLFYSRTAHGDYKKLSPVKTGDTVFRGQELIPLGDAQSPTYPNGAFAYHCHFDISTTQAMKVNPADWPGTDKARVLRDYVDPKTFIVKMKAQEQLKTVNLELGNKVNLYAGPGLTYAVQHGFKAGMPIDVDDQSAVFDTATGLTFYPTPADGYVEASSVGLPELTGVIVPPPPPIVYRYVNTPGSVLVLRQTGETTGTKITTIPHGTKVTLLTPANANGYDQISVGTLTGFGADAYLSTTVPQ